MKHALAFKCFDLFLQVACFIIPAFLTNVMIGWFWFGGAQIFSTLLNVLFLPKDLRAGTRIGYEVFALLFCFLGAITLLNEDRPLGVVESFVWGSCMVSPILALWYMGITVVEISKAGNKNTQQ